MDLAITLGHNEFGMGDAAFQSQSRKHQLILPQQPLRQRTAALQQPRCEDAAGLRHIERRTSITAGHREKNVVMVDDRIDMANVAGDELLHQIVGLFVAQRVNVAPQFFRRLYFVDANGAGQKSRFQHPRGSHALGEVVYALMVKHMHKRRNVERGRLRLHSHGEFVAKVARGGFAHAGDA